MKILLIDDHDMFRDGICMLLKRQYAEIEVLEAKTHKKALEQLRDSASIDLVLMDLHLQDSSPHENIKRVRDDHPNIPIIIISGEERPEFISSILDYGVNGYIPKTVENNEFINALKQVLAGGHYLPHDIATKIKCYQSTGNPLIHQLTQRQKQVLALLAQGLHNQQIATKLSIAENTVSVHVKTILKTLNANNRTEASFLARKYGLV